MEPARTVAHASGLSARMLDPVRLPGDCVRAWLLRYFTSFLRADDPRPVCPDPPDPAGPVRRQAHRATLARQRAGEGGALGAGTVVTAMVACGRACIAGRPER